VLLIEALFHLSSHCSSAEWSRYLVLQSDEEQTLKLAEYSYGQSPFL
jgi:hypothetical protein